MVFSLPEQLESLNILLLGHAGLSYSNSGEYFFQKTKVGLVRGVFTVVSEIYQKHVCWGWDRMSSCNGRLWGRWFVAVALNEYAFPLCFIACVRWFLFSVFLSTPLCKNICLYFNLNSCALWLVAVLQMFSTCGVETCANVWQSVWWFYRWLGKSGWNWGDAEREAGSVYSWCWCWPVLAWVFGWTYILSSCLVCSADDFTKPADGL